MGRRSKLSEAEWRAVERAYRFQSLDTLGMMAGVHPETIRKGFLRRGVKLRPPHKTIGPTGRKPKYRD
jgi:hypothetical protein